METDLLKAVANNDGFFYVFPGGFVRLNRLFPPETFTSSPNARSPVYLEGSFLADNAPQLGEAFGIQRYIAPLCGMAMVKRVLFTAGCAPCRVEFESVGPVFGDTRGN